MENDCMSFHRHLVYVSFRWVPMYRSPRELFLLSSNKAVFEGHDIHGLAVAAVAVMASPCRAVPKQGQR